MESSEFFFFNGNQKKIKILDDINIRREKKRII